MAEQLYIIEMRDGDEWLPTRWTNRISKADAPFRPEPVSKQVAERTLAHAQRLYKDCAYRIVETPC